MNPHAEQDSPAPQAPVPPGQRTVVSFAELSRGQLYAGGIAALEHAAARAIIGEPGCPQGT